MLSLCRFSPRALMTVAFIGGISAVIAGPVWAQNATTPVGIFESHADVGTVLHTGSIDYDASKHTYTISGSGENMWLAADAFQFAWKKVSGDVTLTADISFLNKSGNEHKKAVLMLRQSLDADSVYADVALHASGLTSLQFRDEKGALVTNPERKKISDLDSFPWPDRGRIDQARYVDVWRKKHGMGSVNLITARGCPYKCNWCSHAVFGYMHRRRSYLDCASELEHIMET